ncbi:MAG: tetratricopeptide repeat protein, partial [Methylococcales bacterium]
ALAIRQRLAEKNPDRFEPGYATSLSNYASYLSDEGNNEEALINAKAALAIRQRLVEKNPDRFEPDYATSLSNYANHLGAVGNNEKAVSHAKEALAIRQRLAEKNPDRFEPDYATSLSNYAGYLSNEGNNEEAIINAKAALAIRQRLVEKNPDRFEPNYAMSLGNYASHLSDVGNNEEAIINAKEALAIWQRLAQKTPARYEVTYYYSCCNVLFFNWLGNETLTNPEMQEAITKLPSTMTDYQKASCLFQFHFVQACVAATLTQQAEQFKQVLEQSRALSKSDQHAMQDYFLSSCAWLQHHEPTALTDIDWVDNWQQFQQQRQNRLPQWMLTLAQRLHFEFPEPSLFNKADCLTHSS